MRAVVRCGKGNAMDIVGKIAASDKTYTNRLFGIRLALPEGFSFYDEGQMAELNGSVGELQTDEDVIQALDSGQAFFDMAAGTASGATVTVVIAHASTPDVQALDATGYLEYAKTSLAAQLAAANGELEDAQVGTFANDKAGDAFASMKVRFETLGTPMYEELVCLKAGDYFMTISATAQDRVELDKILGNLSLVK